MSAEVEPRCWRCGLVAGTHPIETCREFVAGPPASLPVFLLARLDEDEAAAKAAHDDLNLGGEGTGWSTDQGYAHVMLSDPGSEFTRRQSPERVLADVEAKRRILAEHQSVQQDKSDWYGGEDPYDDRMLACTRCGTPGEYASPWPCVTLKLLALPYADHPDYRAEWAL